jgi:hypothetical protein
VSIHRYAAQTRAWVVACTCEWAEASATQAGAEMRGAAHLSSVGRLGHHVQVTYTPGGIPIPSPDPEPVRRHTHV